MSDAHVLADPWQIQYPTGTRGMWDVTCSCGYRTPSYVTPAAAMKRALVHQRDKGRPR